MKNTGPGAQGSSAQGSGAQDSDHNCALGVADTAPTNCLHITCGDIASTTLKQCGVAGQCLPWKDLLCIGPLPGSVDYSAFLLQRALFIKQWTQLPELADASSMANAEQQLLQQSLAADAVVIWVWPMLSNQLMLLFLLDWYQQNNFQGMLRWVDASVESGRYDAAYVSSLIGTEKPLTSAQWHYTEQVWAALRHSSPDALLQILAAGESPLPHFNAALWRYVEQLPDAETGLSLLQYRILQAVQSGHHRPMDIYKAVHRHEQYFLAGDWYCWHVIAGMVTADQPLLAMQHGEVFSFPPKDSSTSFAQQQLSLTDAGLQVLNGEFSTINLLDANYAWGGLTINEAEYWLYDKRSHTVKYVG